MDLSIPILYRLKAIGPGVAETTQKLAGEIQALSEANSGTDTEEAKTIEYILNLLNASVKTGTDNKAFAEGNISKLLSIRDSNTRTQFGDMLDTNFVRASNIDLEQINVTGPASLQATNAIISMFSALLTLIPQDIGKKRNTLLDGVNEKRTALEEKITAYKKERSSQTNSTIIKTFSELNQYIQTELTCIAAEAECSTKLKQYQALDKLIEQKSSDILIALISEKKDDHENQEKTVDLNKNISEKITQEIHQIITQFDASTHSFTKKIDELEKRSQSVHTKHKKDSYTPAIEQARVLISNLNKAKIEFKKTGDFCSFQKTTQALLEGFSGHAAFAKNRPKRWFHIFISTPFETLKATLNKLIGLVYTAAPGENKNQFFKPAKTGTTKAFETYEENLKKLDQAQTKPDKP